MWSNDQRGRCKGYRAHCIWSDLNCWWEGNDNRPSTSCQLKNSQNQLHPQIQPRRQQTYLLQTHSTVIPCCKNPQSTQLSNLIFQNLHINKVQNQTCNYYSLSFNNRPKYQQIQSIITRGVNWPIRPTLQQVKTWLYVKFWYFEKMI